MTNKVNFYIGTYTQPILFGTGEVMCGKGEGIYQVEMDLDTGRLTQTGLIKNVDNPSYLNLSQTQKTIYVVNELKEYGGIESGSVSAFSVDPDTGDLTLLSRQPTYGTDPCHVAVSPQDSHIVVSNFMSGSICLYPILPDGGLGKAAQFIQHHGSGPDPRRQRGPHAHSATFDKSGKYVLVPDLGIDKVMIYQFDPQKNSLTPAAPYQAAPGAGPRYCEFHPSLDICYLINELASSISVLEWSNETGALRHLQTLSTLQEGKKTENICADLHITRDGEFLFGSNRGDDTIAMYHLEPDGRMEYLMNVSTAGKTPRNFIIDPTDRYVIAANQDSDNLVVFALDKQRGRLDKVSELSIPTPVCIRIACESSKQVKPAEESQLAAGENLRLHME